MWRPFVPLFGCLALCAVACMEPPDGAEVFGPLQDVSDWFGGFSGCSVGDNSEMSCGTWGNENCDASPPTPYDNDSDGVRPQSDDCCKAGCEWYSGSDSFPGYLLVGYGFWPTHYDDFGDCNEDWDMNSCPDGYVPSGEDSSKCSLCGNFRVDDGESCDGGQYCNSDCTCPAGFSSIGLGCFSIAFPQTCPSSISGYSELISVSEISESESGLVNYGEQSSSTGGGGGGQTGGDTAESTAASGAGDSVKNSDGANSGATFASLSDYSGAWSNKTHSSSNFSESVSSKSNSMETAPLMVALTITLSVMCIALL